MIKSMTGFGRGKHEGEAFACTVEVKSVNHRFLDPHLKLPSEFNSQAISWHHFQPDTCALSSLDMDQPTRPCFDNRNL